MFAKRMISLITTVALTGSLCTNLMMSNVSAEDVPMPEAPSISEDDERNLTITDSTDWTATKVVDGEVNLLDYIDSSKTNTFTGTLDGVTKVSRLVRDNQVASASATHTVYIGIDGCVYAAGSNNKGQLGIGFESADRTSFVKADTLPSNVRALQIATGYLHTVVLGSDGNVYVTGNNDAGQLGLGDTTNRSSFTKVTTLPEGVTASKVSCGFSHTAILGSDGNVYVAGDNDYGQLGLGYADSTDVTSFTKVTTLPYSGFAKNVECGFYQTGVVCQDEVLYMTGLNENGQLGLGDKNNRSSFTAALEVSNGSKSEIVDFSLGYWHTVVIGSNGKIYCAGKCSDGQLGVSNPTDQTSFVSYDLGSTVTPVKVYCGRSNTFVIGDDGKVYATGSNDYGQSALGNEVSVTNFTEVEGLPSDFEPYLINSGEFDSIAIGKDGSVYITGKNSTGQSGVGDRTTRTAFTLANDNEVIVTEFMTNKCVYLPYLNLHLSIPSNIILTEGSYDVVDSDGNSYNVFNALNYEVIPYDPLKGATGDVNVIVDCMAGYKTSEKWTLKSLTSKAKIITVLQNFDRIDYSIDGSDFKVYNSSSKPKLNRWETEVTARTYNTDGLFTENSKVFHSGVTQEQCSPSTPSLTQSKNLITVTDNTDWSLGDSDGVYQTLDKVQYKFTNDSDWSDYSSSIDVTGHEGESVTVRVTNTYGLFKEATLDVSSITIDGNVIYMTQGELEEKVTDLVSKAESSYEVDDITEAGKYVSQLADDEKRTGFEERLSTVSDTIDEWKSVASSLISAFKTTPSLTNFNKAKDYVETLPSCTTKDELKAKLDAAIVNVFYLQNADHKLTKDEVTTYINYLTRDVDKLGCASKMVDLYALTYVKADGELARYSLTLTPDSSAKTTLASKIDEIDALIATWETKCKELVDGINNSPSFDGIKALEDYLATLPDSPTKSEYQEVSKECANTFLKNELANGSTTLTNEQVDYLVGVINSEEKLVEVLTDVLNTPNLENKNEELIKHTISLVTDEGTKANLTAKHNSNLANYDAKVAVEKAESTFNTSDVDKASELVNNLVDEDYKAELLERVNALYEKINGWGSDCDGLIKTFTTSPSKENLEAVLDYLDTIPDCEKKDEIKASINGSIKEVVMSGEKLDGDLISSMLTVYEPKSEIGTLVNEIVSRIDSYNQDDIDNAKVAIGFLGDSDPLKIELTTKVTEVEDDLDSFENQVDDLKDAIKDEPSVENFGDLRDYINGLPNCEIKDSFIEEYNGIAKEFITEELSKGSLTTDDLKDLTSLMTQEELTEFIEGLISSEGVKGFDYDSMTGLLTLIVDPSSKDSLTSNYLGKIKESVSPVVSGFDLKQEAITVDWTCAYQKFNEPKKYQVAIEVLETKARFLSNLAWFDVPKDVTTYTFKDLIPNQPYRVYVRAFYGDAYSPSVPIDLTTKDLPAPVEDEVGNIKIGDVSSDSASIVISDLGEGVVMKAYAIMKFNGSVPNYDDVAWINVSSDAVIDAGSLEEGTEYVILIRIDKDGDNSIIYKNFITPDAEVPEVTPKPDPEPIVPSPEPLTPPATDTVVNPATDTVTNNSNGSGNGNEVSTSGSNENGNSNKTSDANSMVAVYVFTISLIACVLCYRRCRKAYKN